MIVNLTRPEMFSWGIEMDRAIGAGCAYPTVCQRSIWIRGRSDSSWVGSVTLLLTGTHTGISRAIGWSVYEQLWLT